MPYTTVVAGTTITSAWGNANVRDQVVTPFASTSARDSAITAPVNGMLESITGDGILTYYNGSAWVCVTPQSATVATSETTTSATYGALSTAGPAVTVSTGTSALVILSAYLYNTGHSSTYDVSYMGYAVSGATTIAASDNHALRLASLSNKPDASISRTIYETGLTAGSNTFTAQYKTQTATSSTATFEQRTITVIGLP